MEYPWDEGTRDRLNRLFILLAICIVCIAFFYLINAPALERKTEVDPDRNERISRCC